jgi:hypothetical protein
VTLLAPGCNLNQKKRPGFCCATVVGCVQTRTTRWGAVGVLQEVGSLFFCWGGGMG